MQEDDLSLVDEEGSNSSIVSEADITRELELFRQQWYDEIHGQPEKSSDAGTRSKVHQLVVTSEPSDEDQVIKLTMIMLIIIARKYIYVGQQNILIKSCLISKKLSFGFMFRDIVTSCLYSSDVS